MLRHRKALTAREVATITTLGRHSDGGNLYLTVSRTAAGGLSRRWTFLYTFGGKKREAGLGSALDISLKAARERAANYRIMLSHRRDPLEEAKAVKAVPAQKTLYQCMVELVEAKRREWKASRPSYGYANSWYRNFKYVGKLNEMPVEAIDTPAVLEAIKPVWARIKSAKVLLAMIERVLDAAAVQGLRSGDNPARWKGHLALLLPKPLDHVQYKAMPYANVPELIAKLRDDSFHSHGFGDWEREASPFRHDAIYSQAIELLILTATRQQETLDARFDEFNLEEALWVIPAARTKSKRDHRVPLSRQAVALIRKRAELQTGKYVFPGRNGSHIADGMPRRILHDHGAAATLHGFRSSFRDWASNETDFASEVAEAALGYVVGDASERSYRREDALKKRRGLMQLWADYVAPDHG